MDLEKIGLFIAELRKEKGLTQEQFGEQIGVTNKTVSRWERGTYMPPADMLLAMSDLFGVSVNEILYGQKLREEEYRKVAEENLTQTIEQSAFSLKEKQDFYKKKWLKEHIALIVLAVVVWFALVILMAVRGVHTMIVSVIGGMMASSFYTLLYNQMKAYVEKHAFDGSGH